MPISKKPGETKDEFISRCIAIEVNSGKQSEQAAAICYTYWEEKQLSAVKRIRHKNKKFLKDLEMEKTRVFVDSSNVDRLMYNSDNNQMVIQFMDGSFYTYFDISQKTFDSIIDGNAVCKTDDSQTPPRWWEGKTPSVGAAVHKYLINKGVKYEQGGSFR